MTLHLRNACDVRRVFSGAGALKFCDSTDTWSQRPLQDLVGRIMRFKRKLKVRVTVNVCPVVEDEMDEEVMDNNTDVG